MNDAMEGIRSSRIAQLMLEIEAEIDAAGEERTIIEHLQAGGLSDSDVEAFTAFVVTASFHINMEIVEALKEGRSGRRAKNAALLDFAFSAFRMGQKWRDKDGESSGTDVPDKA